MVIKSLELGIVYFGAAEVSGVSVDVADPIEEHTKFPVSRAFKGHGVTVFCDGTRLTIETGTGIYVPRAVEGYHVSRKNGEIVSVLGYRLTFEKDM